VRRLRHLALAALAGAALGSRLPAQDSVGARAIRLVPLGGIGSDLEDRRRLDQLAGRAPTSGWMIRSPSTMSTPLTGGRGRQLGGFCAMRWAVLIPEGDVTWTSDVPMERNDGGVWAGRGATLSATGGARVECGRVRLRVAPQVWYAQNRPFALIGVDAPGRSGFSNPFFSGSWSSDIPIRFGNESMLVVEPGQTSLEVDAGPVTVGLGTESQWWGPAIRNGLLMTNHAAGIPNGYVRTTRPVRSAIGALEARWMVGGLTESRFYDFDGRNDLRSLSGLVVTLTPRVDSNVTIGAARVVYAAVPGVTALPARFLDAVARWGEGGLVTAATEGRGAEQLMNVFIRWVFPRSGFEAYADWARVELPPSLRTFVIAPHHSQGYTLGLQWLRESRPRADGWRVLAEVSNLEQVLESRALNPPSFYISSTVGQGYTQRGQVIGAMIGPGSSSQWVAVDRLSAGTTVGGFLGRVRWTNDAFYFAPTGLSVWAHDVSLYAGGRVARDVGRVRLSADLIAEHRLNYLFQSATIGFDKDRTFDVRNMSVKLRIEPAARD
jgi:hypothetical protein